VLEVPLPEVSLSALQRLLRLIASTLDPRAWVNLLRLVNHYNYDHVTPRRVLTRGRGVRLSPTVSFRSAERISIGDRTRIGDRCSLWAGSHTGRVVIGADCSFGPEVYITASNYEMVAGIPVKDQGTLEADVVIGDGCWLGARVIVVAGVTIGAGSVIGAGAVVTRNIPAGSVAVGVPARVIGDRPSGAG
jgi:acetyltransferase-like isoleucine patch superfamily enzyme